MRPLDDTRPTVLQRTILAALLVTAIPIGLAAQKDARTSLGTRSTTIDSAGRIGAIAAELDRLIDLAPERKNRSVGVQVVSLATGRIWFDLNGSRPLTPASTTKLLTSYASLLLFGADYRIPTLLLSDAAPEDGLIDGNVYVRGHGDPMLRVADIDRFADWLKARGVRRITGDIVGDGTYFDATTERKEYAGDDDHVVDLPPVAGLSIEENMVTVVVNAPRTNGEPCTVQTIPPSVGFTIINGARAGGSSRGGRKGDLNNAGISISVSRGEAGRQIIRVSGTLGANRTYSRAFEMEDPPTVVAGLLHDRLASRGIVVDGGVASRRTPERAALLTQISRPITEVLAPVMKNSHNHYAEFLFRMVGGASSPQPGVNTAAEARRAVDRCLEACGAETTGLMMNDGSGLSRRNLIAPGTLVAALSAAWRNPMIRAALYDAMAVAGVDGTLRRRMRGTPAYNNLRGKTGTLRNVSSLCGYVTTADGEPLAYAMVMNGYNIGGYKEVQNRVAIALARFSYATGPGG